MDKRKGVNGGHTKHMLTKDETIKIINYFKTIVNKNNKKEILFNRNDKYKHTTEEMYEFMMNKGVSRVTYVGDKTYEFMFVTDDPDRTIRDILFSVATIGQHKILSQKSGIVYEIDPSSFGEQIAVVKAHNKKGEMFSRFSIPKKALEEMMSLGEDVLDMETIEIRSHKVYVEIIIRCIQKS